METQLPSASARPAVAGRDLFKMAGQSGRSPDIWREGLVIPSLRSRAGSERELWIWLADAEILRCAQDDKALSPNAWLIPPKR